MANFHYKAIVANGKFNSLSSVSSKKRKKTLYQVRDSICVDDISFSQINKTLKSLRQIKHIEKSFFIYLILL